MPSPNPLRFQAIQVSGDRRPEFIEPASGSNVARDDAIERLSVWRRAVSGSNGWRKELDALSPRAVAQFDVVRKLGGPLAFSFLPRGPFDEIEVRIQIDFVGERRKEP